MFGAILKQLREDAGLTQEQLAHRAEVHRTYISLLEREKKSPTLEVLFRLARALDIRPSAFLVKVEDDMSDDDMWWN